MKKIPKKQVKTCMELTKQYWDTGDYRILEKRIRLAQDMEKSIHVWWDSIINFLDSILATKGICPDATEDEIYCALRCLGWEVTDEKQKG